MPNRRHAENTCGATSLGIPRSATATGSPLRRARQYGVPLSGITANGGHPGDPVHDESDTVHSESRPLTSGNPSAASAPASLVGLWNNPKLPGRVARYASCPHHPAF